MATPTRIYHINMEGVEHLVRASHPSAALMHVARSVAAVRVASQDDLVACLSCGIKIENAREEAPEPKPEPAEDKSLPLWPMPTPASHSQPQADDQAGDEYEYVLPPDNRAAGVPHRQRMPAKYRCPQTGSTWSGRGLKPTWLKVALDGGKQLADFEVTATA